MHKYLKRFNLLMRDLNYQLKNIFVNEKVFQ